jgi:hypothetical protein
MMMGMRLGFVLALAAGILVVVPATAPAWAQSIISGPRAAGVAAQLDHAQPGERGLRCEVAPLKPTLNYSFRFQAGYTVTVPMNQYRGSGHRWTIATRITPRGAAGETDVNPVYLAARIPLPDVPKTNVDLRVGGGYLLGEGSYDVRWMMRDDSGRVCRKSWRVDVHPSRGERSVQVAMPPATVWELGLRGARTVPRATDDAAPTRLTIFLHAAPVSPRRTRLRSNDMVTLMSTVSSLLERMPVKAVRLVLFNLEQQKELYRKEDFHLADMPEVSAAMNGIELGLVDFQVLQNRRGHVDLLAGLLNQELAEADKSDVVLFLGPMARFSDRVPAASLEKRAVPGTQFYYFQIAPLFRAEAVLPDTITSAVGRLGGRTMVIHNPGEFAKAIERVEKGK